MTGFNSQNVIDDLKINRDGEQAKRFTVDMPANNGCDATFTCETIDVVGVEPYTAKQRLRDGSVYAEIQDVVVDGSKTGGHVCEERYEANAAPVGTTSEVALTAPSRIVA